MRNPKYVKQPDTPQAKAAICKASPSFVGLITHHVPDDMIGPIKCRRYRNFKYAFKGYGVILDSQLDTNSTSTSTSASASATYVTTILAPAVLFKRTNHTQPSQVQFEVYVLGGKIYKGELLVCDFHYNIAAIRIQSDSLLKPATFRALNDVSSINIDSYDRPQSRGETSFQLRPHSFKVEPGSKIMILHPSFSPPLFSVLAHSGVFRAYKPNYSCKELYWVDSPAISERKSGAVINYSGNFLGFMFGNYGFLPSNFISRWWRNYSSKGKLYRPWVGVEIANLAEASLSFLQKFRNTFPDVDTGVVVTKVEKDTPAYSSGILVEDVVVKCDGNQVESKIKFFESVWDNAGKSVKLTVLRASDSQQLELCISIGETNPAEFYRWRLPVLGHVSVPSSDDI